MHAFLQFLAICLGLALATMLGITAALFGLLLVFRPQPGAALVVERPALTSDTSDQTTTLDPTAEDDLRYFWRNGQWPDEQRPKSARASLNAKSERPVDAPSESADPGASIRSNLQRIAREQQARLAESQRRYKELTRRADQMHAQTRTRLSTGASRPLTGRRGQSFRGGSRPGGRPPGMGRNR